jgi:hypothetical protein
VDGSISCHSPDALPSHKVNPLRVCRKAMITLTARDRERLGASIERLAAPRSPIAALRKAPALCELVVGVRHLRGSGGLRHATVNSFVEE